VIVYECK
jgi:hypothetical protein